MQHFFVTPALIKKYMKKALFLLIFLPAIFFSCSKKDITSDELTGVVNDFTGRLDGCRILIKLDNGTTLEPYAVPAGFTLIDNKRVKLRYRVLPDKVSNCMAGLIAEIVSISYL